MGFMTRRNLARKAKRVAEQVVKTEVETEVKTKPDVTKEQVMSMPYFKVKSVAQANGIDVADKKTAELRAEVIERLGL